MVNHPQKHKSLLLQNLHKSHQAGRVGAREVSPAQPWAAGSAGMLCYTKGNSQSMDQYVNHWRFIAVSV